MTRMRDADALLFSISPAMEERPEKSKPQVGEACGTLRYKKVAVKADGEHGSLRRSEELDVSSPYHREI